MTSLSNSDMEGEMRGKLEGHLKSGDFFSTEEYPMASLVIQKVSKKGNGYEVVADLTIKGKTEEVVFPASVQMKDGQVMASAELSFDRTKYDIRYGSGSFFDNLGDKAISDEVKLSVQISASK